MYKKFYLLPILALVMSLTFISCGDDDGDGDEPQKSTTEYLTSGSWNITTMTIDPPVTFGGIQFSDFLMQMDACEKDDIVTFNSNGTITDDEGATKCDPTDPQTTTEGTWSYNAGDNTLTISYPDDAPVTVTITTINDSSLTGTYSQEEDFGNGPTVYTFTIGFSKV